jgi:hypothetical protein
VFLKGTKGDSINALMAAAAFNFKSLINKIKQGLFDLFEMFICFIFPKGKIKQNLSC